MRRTVVKRLSSPLVKVRRYTFSAGRETTTLPLLASMGRLKRISPVSAALFGFEPMSRVANTDFTVSQRRWSTECVEEQRFKLPD